MGRTLPAWLVPLAAALGLACGGGNGKYGTMGTLGEPTTALIAGNLVFVNAAVNSVDQASGYFGMLIDSGSPVVLLDPTFFGAAPPATSANVQQHVNLGLLDGSGNPAVTIDGIPVLEVSNAMMDALGFGGILGGDVLRDFSVQLDYSAPMMDGFCLGCSAMPRADVQAMAAVPFKIAGGGIGPVDISPEGGPTLALPPTRIPLTVVVEGVMHPFILDTGASEVSVRTSLYDTLTADGRAQLTGFGIQTVTGATNASVTRAKSLMLGAETVADAPVMTIPGDDLLDNLSKEIDPSGQTMIDGLLGGSFLRNFLVTIDYPHGELDLQPYTTPPIPDEFRRVGFTLGLDSTGMNFVVASVYPNTDAAAQGVSVGDQIVAIGGTNLASVSFVIDADNLLDGTPGTTIQIQFGTTTSPDLMNKSIAIQVDDLIPDP